MAKKNSTAVVKVGQATISKPDPLGERRGYTVLISKDGKTKTFGGITDKLKSSALEVGLEATKLIRTLEDKMEIVMNLTYAYDEYKDCGGSSVAAFAQTYLDPTIPYSSYGKPGSPERQKMNQHKVFTGIENMIKTGHRAIKVAKEQKALTDAGVDISSSKAISTYNKDKREEKTEAETKAFTKSMIDFETHGLSDKMIENHIITVLHKKDKNSDTMNDAGKKLHEAATKALFVLRKANLAKQIELQEKEKTSKKKSA